MNCLIPGLHFTEVTRDQVCLVYALMKDLPINVGTVLKLVMRKARVHREENVDYMAPLFTTPLDVTKTKGLENMHGPTVTTTERNKRDDMITTCMFGLEMLHHRNGCRALTQEQLDEIATKYPLNEHTDALLGLGPAFLEPVWDDVPTDEDKRRTMSDSESDSDVKNKEEWAKIRHLDRGWKIEDKVAEENGQEAGKYTKREQLRDTELKLACKK
ncbi:hypothetical protein H5410_057171 [Solanum commersonii]|uniref:Uncharacterized protein n=1 Tax=Solanum commersonii TaxID=4109 RepID=A0A9J5WNX2_SOLCO|nr:hypothetical protein H5410_057171 [Solanum commersonii]